MVTVAISDQPYTVEQLQDIPDDGLRYEILGGQLFMTPAPSTKHQFVLSELNDRLKLYLKTTGSGVVLFAPVEVRFDIYDSVQPDLVVVLNEHADRILDSRIEGAPDVVVEILSPSTRGIDRVRKAALYATSGVREYWIVDPDQETILVQVLRNGMYLPLEQRGESVRSEVLDGFSVSPDALFVKPGNQRNAE